MYEGLASTVAPFNDALVSLPDSGNTPVSLAELYGTGGDMYVKDFTQRNVLEPSVAKGKVEDDGLLGHYMDTVLRHPPKQYTKFVRRLAGARMIEYHATPIESVGMFFVRNKDGRLRLVIEALRSNCWFLPPASVELATGAGLGEVELQEGEELIVGHVDIVDAFYHFELPSELRGFFALPLVRARDVGASDFALDSPVFPRLSVLPMGWSHALCWCQMHCKLMKGVGGLSDSCFIKDRSVVPLMAPASYTIYVENCWCSGAIRQQSAVSSRTPSIAYAAQGFLRMKYRPARPRPKYSVGALTVLQVRFVRRQTCLAVSSSN